MKWLCKRLSSLVVLVVTACGTSGPTPTRSPIPAGPLPPIPATATATPIMTLTPECNQKGTVQWLNVEGVGEIGLYLPPCYDAHSSQLYPSLYLLPGFGGGDRDWIDNGVAQIADKLILNREIPPLIMVTTPNTFNDFEVTFVTQKLIPYLESHYHASAQRQDRTVMGGSLGGASVYHLVLTHPDMFANGGIFGAGAARGEEEKIRGWLTAIPRPNRPRFFLNCGENDTDMLNRAKILISLLDETHYSHTEIFSPGSHSYAYWSSNFSAFLHWLTQK